MMELGETICLPERGADCSRCPVRGFCRAHAKGTAQVLPVRRARTEKKQEKLTVFIIMTPDGRSAISKRKEHGLLAGMYEFPNTAGHLSKDQALSWVQAHGLTIESIHSLPSMHHIFTHKKWLMKGFRVCVSMPEKKDEPFQFVLPSDLDHLYSMPGAFSKFKPFLS